MPIAEVIRANYARVRERIAAACERIGRDPASVTLIAVTKYAQLDWVRALVDEGATDLGESRPQQLVARADELHEPVRWHLIGSLQRNKVRMILPFVEMIHSVDNLRLLDAIDRIAGELGLAPRVLLEVNLTGELAKHGFGFHELRSAWSAVEAHRNVRFVGLMTMAAHSENPEDARFIFKGLHTLRSYLSLSARGDIGLRHLSMGMSGDFEVAIEEGATLVRIGSALWEGLADAT